LEDAEGEERLNINLESLKERATSDPLKLSAPVFQGCTFYRFWYVVCTCVHVCLCACRQIYGDLKLPRTPATHSCSNCGWGCGCGCGCGCGIVSNAIPLTPPPTSHTNSQTWIVCNEKGWSQSAHWVRRRYHARVCLYVRACVRACVSEKETVCVRVNVCHYTCWDDPSRSDHAIMQNALCLFAWESWNVCV